MKAEVLESIIKFTDNAHGEQKRKFTNERYIVHPIRVMQTCQQYIHEPYVLAAALFHDVLEDTPVTELDLASFLTGVFPAAHVHRTIELVKELTDVYTKKSYPGLNRRDRKKREVERLAAASYEAQTIKYADVMDNSVNIVNHDPDFGYVFLQEAKALLEKMNKGNESLYHRTLHTIDECLQRVKRPLEKAQ